MIIAVSGNVGSGKTTVAKYLSEYYSFQYVPRHRFEFDFIDDFFEDIEGKFFPAQVSFLLSKAIEIQHLSNINANVVVDRSLLEDIKVFARLWIENRKIDEKIVQLYNETASFILSSIPKPDLYLVCKCSAEISTKRIAMRSVRSFEKKYPPNHISLLEKYYSELFFDEDVPYVEIDSELYDLSDVNVIKTVIDTIFFTLSQQGSSGQLSLFEENKPSVEAPGLKYHNFNEFTLPFVSEEKKQYIYLAAPFSQFATESRLQQNNFVLHDENTSYGALQSQYKSRLIRIEKAIEQQCSSRVMVPHRDIYNWGKTLHKSEYLTPRIVNSINDAKAVIAIPGNSIGVHLEIGLAIARNIPIVIYDLDEFESSFFVEGFSKLSNVKYLKLSSLSQIPASIKNDNIANFIEAGEKNERIP